MLGVDALSDHAPHVDLPSTVAEVLRPELGSLTAEIVDDIRTNIPEYARPLDGPYGQAIREGVHYALTLFVDQIGDAHAAKDESMRVHYKLGKLEVREGRSMNSLQAAYRLGARVSWRRLMAVSERCGLSTHVISQLGEAMFAFMDELSAVALRGYLEAKASRTDALRSWRRKLLASIARTPQEPHAAITELATLVGWRLPERMYAVALGPRESAESQATADALDVDILAELDDDEPHLLVPGEADEHRMAAIAGAFDGRRVAVGPSVPIECAPESLRWARRALAVGPEHDTVFTAQHVPELLVNADSGLIEWLRHRWFARLDDMTVKQHKRIVETLRAWLDFQGAVPAMARNLGVHAQTVRYRMELLTELFGDSLNDPDARFEMQLVLRAGLSQRKPS